MASWRLAARSGPVNPNVGIGLEELMGQFFPSLPGPGFQRREREGPQSSRSSREHFVHSAILLTLNVFLDAE